MGHKLKGLAMAILAGALLPTFAQAQPADYPNKAIRLIVPYPPGGGTDVAARFVAEKLQLRWGQALVVDNRSGAGGNVGTEVAYRAAPDGYTILITSNPPLVSNKALYGGRVNFDPEKFTSLLIISTVNSFLVVHPNVPANTLAEFIAYAKANPGKLNYASQGVGNAAHLAAEYFDILAGVKMTHVPYKGTGPAVADLVGGQVDVMFTEMGPAGAMVRAGKLKVLGNAGEKASPAAPQAPLISRTLPGFNVLAFQAAVAPPGTPAHVVDKWVDGINDTLTKPDVLARMRDLDMVPMGGTPQAMDKFLKQERERWEMVIKATGAKAE